MEQSSGLLPLVGRGHPLGTATKGPPTQSLTHLAAWPRDCPTNKLVGTSQLKRAMAQHSILPSAPPFLAF